MIYTILLTSLIACCETSFNFRNIVKENLQFETFIDRCPLRILGGVSANITEIPYQVAIRKRHLGVYWFTFCGGSIITLRYVITAAHCFVHPDHVQKLSNTKVVAGTTRTLVSFYKVPGEMTRNINALYLHANYSAKNDLHDIAILKLEYNLEISRYIKPIRMVSDELMVDLSRGTLVLVSGFGHKENSKSSSDLQMVCVPIITQDECMTYYHHSLITKYNFCAFGLDKDSCQGDSGGPLVCHGILVGLVSWGGECGTHPSVNLRLESYTTQDVPFVELGTDDAQAKSASYAMFIILVTIVWLCT